MWKYCKTKKLYFHLVCWKVSSSKPNTSLFSVLFCQTSLISKWTVLSAVLNTGFGNLHSHSEKTTTTRTLFSRSYLFIDFFKGGFDFCRYYPHSLTGRVISHMWIFVCTALFAPQFSSRWPLVWYIFEDFKRPCKKKCIFGGHHVEKIIEFFLCICAALNLRQKKNVTDAALWRCSLLVLVSCFLPRKRDVFPEKVGKMAFSGCSEIK